MAHRRRGFVRQIQPIETFDVDVLIIKFTVCSEEVVDNPAGGVDYFREVVGRLSKAIDIDINDIG